MVRADRAYAALYGLAIGDALGMPTQFMSHEEVVAHFGVIDGFQEAPADHPHRGWAASRVNHRRYRASAAACRGTAGRPRPHRWR